MAVREGKADNVRYMDRERASERETAGDRRQILCINYCARLCRKANTMLRKSISIGDSAAEIKPCLKWCI